MDNNIQSSVSEKYAVYTLGADGKDVLSVVVDSHDDAKKELEKLKSGTACIKINKSKVENFGKEGEKTIESVEVECWKKENESSSGDKLSSFQKAPEATPVSANGGEAPAINSLPNPINENSFQKKLNAFYDYYSHSGDIIGVGFGFFPAPIASLETTSAIASQVPANGSSDNASGQALPSSESGIKGGDEKDEIKKLTAEISELKEKINELVKVEKEEHENDDSNDKDDKE